MCFLLYLLTEKDYFCSRNFASVECFVSGGALLQKESNNVILYCIKDEKFTI